MLLSALLGRLQDGIVIAVCFIALVSPVCADSQDNAQTSMDDAAIEALYFKSCASCHARGSGGAPRTGDAAAWQQRLDQKGMAGLLASAINGVPNTAMVPKGFCAQCSDEQFTALIRWMSTAR